MVLFSIRNQLRYRGNLVRHVKKDEKRYYEELVDYSRKHLMLFPYHLSDVVVKGLRITPFQYYVMVLEVIMAQERSYDSLPNFTAVDCLRLLGIGRNQVQQTASFPHTHTLSLKLIDCVSVHRVDEQDPVEVEVGRTDERAVPTERLPGPPAHPAR